MLVGLTWEELWPGKDVVTTLFALEVQTIEGSYEFMPGRLVYGFELCCAVLGNCVTLMTFSLLTNKTGTCCNIA